MNEVENNNHIINKVENNDYNNMNEVENNDYNNINEVENKDYNNMNEVENKDYNNINMNEVENKDYNNMNEVENKDNVKMNEVENNDYKMDIIDTDDPETKDTKPPKKTLKQKIIKGLKITGTVILGIILIYTLFTIICSIYEKSKIRSYNYGTKLDVNGHTMNVKVVGEKNEPTIVILTGMASPSPVLHYKPVTEALSDKFRIIVLEPFGYGLSDIVDDERTIDKITSELHTAIEKLGVKEYYLMGHSIGGLYSLQLANQYPDEVLGYVGLDPTVPRVKEYSPSSGESAFKVVRLLNTLGFTRIPTIFNKKNLILPLYNGYNYTDEELSIFKNLSLSKSFNKNVINEISHLFDNADSLRDKKFPKNIPVITYLASQNNEKFDNYKPVHEEVGNESISNEVIVLEGNHVFFVFDNF